MGILISQNEYTPVDAVKIEQKLPKAVYTLNYDMLKGFYLTKDQDFKLPKKIYGDMSVINRWLSYWKYKKQNVGVLLSGLKGSGKTLTMVKTCIEADAPVIQIKSEFYDKKEQVLSFLQKEEFKESVILIDEFEKIFYNGSDSTWLLQLMDGSIKTNFLFILTVNKEDISTYLINRLNRIRYYKHYGSLNIEEVEEVVDDFLQYPELKKSLMDLIDSIPIITYDILTNIIEEMNIFKEDAKTVISHLNIKPESVRLTVNQINERGEDSGIDCEDLHGCEIKNLNKYEILRYGTYIDKDGTERMYKRVDLSKPDTKFKNELNSKGIITVVHKEGTFILRRSDRKNNLIF